jgi:hypothetical protein
MTTINRAERSSCRYPRTFFRSGYDGEVDGPVVLGVGQALDLGNVEVGVDVGALVLSISVVRQDPSARLAVRYNKLSLIVDFVHRASTHGMDKNRSNSCFLEPGLETPQNRFGPLKVIGICL